MQDIFQDCLIALDRAGTDRALEDLYGAGRLDDSKKRMARLLGKYRTEFNSEPDWAITAPGRTELSGNHTDHNHGRVMAAAVHLDIMALCADTGDMNAVIYSEGYDPVRVNLDDTSSRDEEEGTVAALVRGVADHLVKSGFRVGGFRACVSSTIPAGTGLSSSAAFSVLMGRIFSHLFNNTEISPLDIALAAKRAENLHFGKPCGFMDQTACSYMGAISIDFMDPDNPVVDPVPCDFLEHGIVLCVVNTGGSHADLTEDYAAINREMRRASSALGQGFARGLTIDQVLEYLPRIREKAGDRAALRLFHFIEENQRVRMQVKALLAGNMDEFLRLAWTSGRSSTVMLQNCYDPKAPEDQPISLALAVTRRYLSRKGACRVHGGGFAGTIQAFVPKDRFAGYREYMDSVFGPGAVISLEIRKPGGFVIPLPGIAGKEA